MKNKKPSSRIFTCSGWVLEVDCLDSCMTQFVALLQAGQYTSIFVDNAAGASVTIQNGSDFMGMLLGV